MKARAKENDIDLMGLSRLQNLFGDGEDEKGYHYEIRILKLEDTYDFEKHTLKMEYDGDIIKEILVEHPFDIADDEEMEELTESIREYGVLEPGICRPGHDGMYEVISGHRRKHAAFLAGITEMPFIIRDLSDAEATIIMVDSNKYRKNIKLSVYAKAMYMKYCAVRHQGKRTDLIRNLDELEEETQGEDLDELASKEGMSLRKLQRLIRLAYLSEEILCLVDQKKLGVTSAVALSYLKTDEQDNFYNCIVQLGTAQEPYIPVLEEANQLKRLSKNSENGLQEEDIFSILSKDTLREVPRDKDLVNLIDQITDINKEGKKKKAEKKISFPREKIMSYFPETYTQEDIEEIVFDLLGKWKAKNNLKDNSPLPGQIDLADYMASSQ